MYMDGSRLLREHVEEVEVCNVEVRALSRENGLVVVATHAVYKEHVVLLIDCPVAWNWLNKRAWNIALEHHVEESLEPGYALWIPPGFAHGFQALEDTYFLYLVTKEYAPQLERCIKWDDPDIGISWPIREGVIVSEKDKKCPPLKEAETNFEY